METTILVGGIPIPLKKMGSSIGMTIPNLWKNQMKPTNPNAHTYVTDTDVQSKHILRTKGSRFKI